MSVEEQPVQDVETYKMHLLDENLWDLGTPKTVLEPIVDYWLEEYDWRVQEAAFNHSLPQFRTTVQSEKLSSLSGEHEAVRIHFAHKRSSATRAIPLLFCHGWPPSFTEVVKVIDSLTDPIATPPRGSQDALGFHVIAPSIPGFGFSDASPDESFGLRSTAEVFDSLMKRLGYAEYVAYGGDWGFKICRMLALHHKRSCLAIYTNSPDVPPPTFRIAPLACLKYHVARLTRCRMPFLSFGYLRSDIESQQHHHSRLPRTNPFEEQSFRPQTTAHSLCDSPVGLLACMLDAIRPSLAIHEWPKNDILNWTMMHWLPGPEAALRWLRQASHEARSECWYSYSITPLGVSSFGKLPGEQLRYPPLWTEAWQRLCWLRRHERPAKWAAWDAPEETVMDMRDCFADMLEKRVIVFPSLEMNGVD
ncbi:MAG: hypothetical protein M1820_001599 [Bogoriella megaspora]|nr:MAG: hypothetical protein M1820_001599 [Bogoriella megaspora]